jgi:DNA invertase Pin-like site-specific DNA recombinase
MSKNSSQRSNARSPLCIAYLRVSSRAQDHATQRAAIERAAEARGDQITVWYAEKKSAGTLARPELDRLRAAARTGDIVKLYLFRLDRLTRSGIRDTFEVVEELHRHGVELVSVADGFDLNGPAAEVILAVIAWAAKMERLAINERIAAARERVEAEGRAWGRPRRLDDQAVARVQSLRRAGRSLRQISVALKVPLATVARAARAPCQKPRSGRRINSPLGDRRQRAA